MDVVVLGKLGRPYGLKGWQFFTHYMEDPLSVTNYHSLLIENSGEGWYEISEPPQINRHSDKFIIKIKEVSTKEEAHSYCNKLLGVRREHLPHPDEGSYYWHDLIGMQVFNSAGTGTEAPVGRILAMRRCGGADVMEIEEADREGTKRTTYIPFVLPEPVYRVDLRSKRVCVSWQSPD